jgi:hypothetical protein
MGNPSYPSNKTNRANNFSSMFATARLPYGAKYNNCSNTLCYTWNKNYIYKPHSANGMVGTSAAGYLGRRNRL